jgi:hypothetical protein
MFAKFFSSIMIALTSLFGGALHSEKPPVASSTREVPVALQSTSTEAKNKDTSGQANAKAQVVANSNLPSTLSAADLLSLAGELPKSFALGDKKYVTTGAKKGYVYFCNIPGGSGGGAAAGAQTWISGASWFPGDKISESGSVAWHDAKYSNTVSGGSRVLSGNGLPINHKTGVFPVSSSDPAYVFDRNPNSIKNQSLKDTLPVNPVYSATPYCMGMEAGVMLSGVPIFSGFDADLRDAVAYEVQDSCGGHPEKNGQYHYHGLSQCFNDVGVSTVLGYAFDGFPITGPKVADNKYLLTEDLDVCHGITSEVIIDGKSKATYHYVMTADFPYSVGCFRGKPAMYSALGGNTTTGTTQGGGTLKEPTGLGPRTPPKEAITACESKQSGTTCSFSSPMGTLNGMCSLTPDGIVACIPRQ